MRNPDYDQPIPGLCPNKCSCLQCRQARIADPGYQAYLDVKRKRDIKIERELTMANAIECDRIGQLGFKGHVAAVNNLMRLCNGKT